MFVNVYVFIYLAVVLASIVWMLVEQERLFKSYKVKKHLREPLTLGDLRKDGRNVSEGVFPTRNFAVAARRLAILRSRHPEDKELDGQMIKVRLLLGLSMAIIVTGFLLFAVYVLSLSPPA
jgi:hypothetical protein